MVEPPWVADPGCYDNAATKLITWHDGGMSTAIKVLVGWVVISIPVGILTGKYLKWRQSRTC
jgi:hypothetical protein